jgi:hypothetical protein
MMSSLRSLMAPACQTAAAGPTSLTREPLRVGYRPTTMTTALTTSLRRSGARRTRSLAALVTGLALAAGLAGCGDDGTDDTATDPAASSSTPSPSASDEPSETPTDTGAPETGEGGRTTVPAKGSAGVTEATVVHATEGGGSASTLAFALDSDMAVADFVGQLEGGFGDTVEATAADVAEQAPDATPYAAVVAVGCQGPRSVVIDAGEAGFEVTPRMPKNTVECLAPMTYVVVFSAPNA